MKQGIRRVSIINSTITKRERERESSSRLICHTERSEVSQVESNRDISVSAKPQYDKAGGHNVISPSLAEGARGWVDTTSTLRAKLATASKYATSVIARICVSRFVAIHKSIESVVIASERSERGNPQKKHRLLRESLRILSQ